MPPQNQNNKIAPHPDRSVQIVKEEHFSGPLPHPEILQRYETIVPGAAERILKKFEAQTEHRQRLERKVVWTDSFKSITGLFCAFIIAMTTIIGGIYTALHGASFLGGSLSFTGLALVIGAFLTNRYSKTKN